MPRISPREAAEKFARRTTAAIPDMLEGVRRVTDSPMEAAAAQMDKMLARLMAAVQSGKWSRNLLAVSLEQWKAATLAKGGARVAAGVEASKAKVEEVYGRLFPHIEAGQRLVRDMPDATIEDSIQRAAVFMRHMATFER